MAVKLIFYTLFAFRTLWVLAASYTPRIYRPTEVIKFPPFTHVIVIPFGGHQLLIYYINLGLNQKSN